MLRQTLFCEIEVVRYEDGEQTAPSRRLEFSLRPLNCLVASVLVALALTAVGGFAYCLPKSGPWPGGTACQLYPQGDEPWDCFGCACRLVATGGDVVTPLPKDGDSTRLVRGLP